METPPWDGWYHCMGNTYGTWLRGDERGWRARHHREHVDGDYKHRPPAGKYEAQKQQSLTTMKRPPVRLTAQQRRIVCDALVEKLLRDEVEVAACVVTATHFHLVARFPNYKRPGMAMPGLSPGNTAKRGAASVDPAPRHYLGRAKKHASHILRAAGLTAAGCLRATPSELLPIDSQSHHQKLITRYLPDHAPHEDAALWQH